APSGAAALTRAIPAEYPSHRGSGGFYVKFARLMLGAAALGPMAVPFTAANAQNTIEKPGSAYVQCDGQPDNVTDGETAARLLGAVTLLGLFAPPHESPDASKRKFAAEGVAARSEERRV